MDHLPGYPASQAAIAIYNATLTHDLQRSNHNLQQAYDTTLEGWSHALDLRDKETEGHTRRVTQKTIAMVQALGFPEELIIHVKRGALLHDIGKMGIPDSILLKAGPLTEEKWRMMRMHPLYAYEMLSPIQYLLPALDIPYYHHEHWDGSGYPCELVGEDIPIAAQIFSIVDVWDALISDRPYRPAWSFQRAIDYLGCLAGSQFDPTLVNIFLEQDWSLVSMSETKVSLQW
jgi:HD-GYP domain-containing protein (c-di-GMP phosphodiesterase class II)